METGSAERRAHALRLMALVVSPGRLRPCRAAFEGLVRSLTQHIPPLSPAPRLFPRTDQGTGATGQKHGEGRGAVPAGRSRQRPETPRPCCDKQGCRAGSKHRRQRRRGGEPRCPLASLGRSNPPRVPFAPLIHHCRIRRGILLQPPIYFPFAQPRAGAPRTTSKTPGL